MFKSHNKVCFLYVCVCVFVSSIVVFVSNMLPFRRLVSRFISLFMCLHNSHIFSLRLSHLAFFAFHDSIF